MDQNHNRWPQRLRRDEEAEEIYPLKFGSLWLIMSLSMDLRWEKLSIDTSPIWAALCTFIEISVVLLTGLISHLWKLVTTIIHLLFPRPCSLAKENISSHADEVILRVYSFSQLGTWIYSNISHIYYHYRNCTHNTNTSFPFCFCNTCFVLQAAFEKRLFCDHHCL